MIASTPFVASAVCLLISAFVHNGIVVVLRGGNPRYAVKSFTSRATFVILPLLVSASFGCSDTPTSPPLSKSEYAENVHVVATRKEGNLTVEIKRPPRADGFTETCMVIVYEQEQGENGGRHLLAETNRKLETSNERSMSTELTDRERSVALDVKVDFAVWTRGGYHNSSELFRGSKVVNLPLPRNLPKTVDLRPAFEKMGLQQRSQGRRQTSSVFTAVEAVEFAHAKAVGESSPLSVEFANWAANNWAPNTSRRENVDGPSFYNILFGVEKYGICPEEMMPYAESFSDETKPTEEATQKASESNKQTKLRFNWIRALRPDLSIGAKEPQPGLSDEEIHAVKTVLAIGNPVCAGSSQSVLLVGYEDEPSLLGGGRFLITDSSLAEKDIDYEAAKTRFKELFWLSAAKQQSEETASPSGDAK